MNYESIIYSLIDRVEALEADVAALKSPRSNISEGGIMPCGEGVVTLDVACTCNRRGDSTWWNHHTECAFYLTNKEVN